MSTPTWNGEGLHGLIEQPSSGSYEINERVYRRQIWRGPYAFCVAALQWRGAYGLGVWLGWRVASAEVTREKGDIGTLIITWTIGGLSPALAPGIQLPPWKYSAEPYEFRADIHLHPMFAPLRGQPGFARLNHDYFSMPLPEQTQLRSWLLKQPGSNYALAVQLLDLLDMGVKDYPETGVKLSWTWYSWTRPAMTFGRNQEIPGGPFSGAFPATIVFRRLPDRWSFDGSVHTVTSGWDGKPVGTWDLAVLPLWTP